MRRGPDDVARQSLEWNPQGDLEKYGEGTVTSRMKLVTGEGFGI